MKFTTTLLALATAVAAPGAFAQSTDLTVTGKILPGACVVELGNGGNADLGDIYARDLNADAVTELEPVTLPLSVACESETLFAFEGIDNASESSTDTENYGLGLTPAEEKIGNAAVRIGDVTVDDVEGHGTQSADSGASWSQSNNTHWRLKRNHLLGYALNSGVSTGPAPVEVLAGTLTVIATIQPTNELTVAADVPINGNVTLNLIYL